MAISASQLERSLQHCAKAVAVVTTTHGNVENGVLALSFAVVSYEPPLVLIGIDKTTNTNSLIKRSKCFAVNLLAEEQAKFAEIFADSSKEGVRFEGIHYWTSNTGCPILPGSVASLSCKLVKSHVYGDSVLHVGRVIELFGDAKKPLLDYKGKCRGLGSSKATE